jgi:NAD(P)H-hydrate epimerase
MSDPIQPITEVPPVPERADNAHKGDVGGIVIVGGRLDEYGMVGAPGLAANAALRSGAGLIQVLTPRNAQVTVALIAPCATSRALPEDAPIPLASVAIQFGADVVAIGPGLDPRVDATAMNDLVSKFSGAIVIDADGLNLLATMGSWQAAWPHQVILTPHPGEMRRLLDGWGIKADPNDRQDCAIELAKKTSAIVVLKGAGTVVTDGQHVYVNQTGNSGMATAGSGDVLTGVIAALLGQQMLPFDAATLSVYIHGLAGDIAAEEVGRLSLMATDLVEYLPDALGDLSISGEE